MTAVAASSSDVDHTPEMFGFPVQAGANLD